MERVKGRVLDMTGETIESADAEGFLLDLQRVGLLELDSGSARSKGGTGGDEEPKAQEGVDQNGCDIAFHQELLGDDRLSPEDLEPVEP